MSLRKGFSMIELLIVVAIMALLTAIAVPNYFSIMENATLTRDRSNARVMADAINVYLLLDQRTALSEPINGDTSPLTIKRALMLSSLWPKGDSFTTAEYLSEGEMQLFDMIGFEDGVFVLKESDDAL